MVYHPESDKFYLFPVSFSKRQVKLSLTTKTKKDKRIHFASEFEFKGFK